MKSGLEHMNKEQLVAYIKKQEQALNKKDQTITTQQQWIDKLRRMLFGTKSERFTKSAYDPAQLRLSFAELNELTQQSDSEQTVEEKTKDRVSKASNHKGRNKIPKTITEKVVVLEPDESTEGLTKIGEERTEILEYIPGRFFKLVFIRPKYEKPNKEGVLIAPMPDRPIDKCLAGDELLSSILINKYVDHLPLYRQQQIFKRSDITIASSTIDSWVKQLGILLEPLYDAMVKATKKTLYIQADETPTKVLDRTKKGDTHRGYYWVYHAPLNKMVVFNYQPGRGKDAPRKFLDDYEGYLQTDGYAGYNDFKNKKEITHLGCWAHVRRKFENALKQDKFRASHAMEQIQKLYSIERDIKDLDDDLKKQIRLKKSLTIINAFGKWIVEQNKLVLPSSLIGKAYLYAINIWDSLTSYLHEGSLLIDNNLIENTIRPIAIGRKNYLFAGSHAGATRSAMFYTFFANCKLNAVDPHKWLTYTLRNINNTTTSNLYKLFPQEFHPQK